ncbi:MAG TPA: universal stress protein, partial [Flavisolibacter sp.]|nr:universal stress protein [Flavisolibacter sp.]
MLKTFKIVLIPVDFSVNTEVAVARALNLIGQDDATIYLLHVFRTFPFLNNTAAYSDCVKKLEEWKASLEEGRKKITVHSRLLESSSVQSGIRATADELRPDVIVIGQSGVHSHLLSLRKVSPMKLAKATGIPVLTAKPGSMPHKTKTVIVPVSDTLPASKMQALEVLCQHTKLNIHLITLVNDRSTPSEFSASTLLQMYQWLKTSLRCPVEYAVVHGSNKAKAILQYAEKTGAD